MKLAVVLSLGSLIAAAGCGTKAGPTSQESIGPDSIDHDPATVYDVRIAATAVSRDGEGEVSFEAMPIRPWHVNLAFPTRVELDAAPGLGIDQHVRTKTDARIIEKGGIRFLVPVQGTQPGTHAVKGRFLFAMCSDGKDCVAIKHKFDLDVTVE